MVMSRKENYIAYRIKYSIIINSMSIVGRDTMDKVTSSQIFMTDKVIVRSGEDVSFIGFQILPKDSTQGFFVKSSPFIKVGIKEADSEENLRVLSVRGENMDSEILEGYVRVVLDDGTEAECQVQVLPEYIAPPRFSREPSIRFEKGYAILDYEYENLGENIDQSQISWYRLGKIEKSRFAMVNFFKRTTEEECRRIAITRQGNSVRRIQLTTADIGKYIKIGIKPKHNNSYIGQEIFYISEMIKEEYVQKDKVVLNVESVDDNAEYEMLPGYFTVRGDLVSEEQLLTGEYGLLTESMGCGIYYTSDVQTGSMILNVNIDPECKNGNGFGGIHQYEEIYIKYDPIEQNGYGLRIESTAPNDGKVNFGLYHYKNGNGTLISEQYSSDAFRVGCEINLEVDKDIFNVFITYDDGEDFSDLELRAKIKENTYGGFGFKHMAEATDGYRCYLKGMVATYK